MKPWFPWPCIATDWNFLFYILKFLVTLQQWSQIGLQRFTTKSTYSYRPQLERLWIIIVQHLEIMNQLISTTWKNTTCKCTALYINFLRDITCSLTTYFSPEKGEAWRHFNWECYTWLQIADTDWFETTSNVEGMCLQALKLLNFFRLRLSMRLIFGVQSNYRKYWIGAGIVYELITDNRTDSYTRNTSGQWRNQKRTRFSKFCKQIQFDAPDAPKLTSKCLI